MMKIKRNEPKETGALTFLYGNLFGRVLLKILTLPAISFVCGYIIELPLSRHFIGGYIRRHHIDISRFEETDYRDFNAFFTRRLRVPAFEDKYPPDALRAPCDGKLSVYAVDEDCSFRIKNSVYTLSDLVGSQLLAESYSGGICLVFRLTPDDYHRYCFIDDGDILSQKKIKGILHTVRPIAHSHYPVFVQNTRVCTVMQTNHFDTIAQVEIGAMLVGKIRNHKSHGRFAYGEEKGFFEFGGSTVILLIKNGVLRLSEAFELAKLHGEEYALKVGEIIGCKEERSETKCEF